MHAPLVSECPRDHADEAPERPDARHPIPRPPPNFGKPLGHRAPEVGWQYRERISGFLVQIAAARTVISFVQFGKAVLYGHGSGFLAGDRREAGHEGLPCSNLRDGEGIRWVDGPWRGLLPRARRRWRNSPRAWNCPASVP